MCSPCFLSLALPTPSLRVCASRPLCSLALLGLSIRLSLPLSLSPSRRHHLIKWRRSITSEEEEEEEEEESLKTQTIEEKEEDDDARRPGT